MNTADVTFRKVGGAFGFFWVYVDGKAVASMERSPFTGEFTYGLKDGEVFRPRFQTTGKKTAAAAAKVAAAASAR